MSDELRSPVISFPPNVGDPRVYSWMREVYSAINALPFSLFSTTDGPNNSSITAPEGFIGIEIGSSVTKVWVKTSGSTSTGWSQLSDTRRIEGSFSTDAFTNAFDT